MPAGIFISYRRQEALAEARGIYERLRAEFGHSSVFIDLEGLDYGEDFVESLDRQLQHCQVLLALIGPQWLATPDGHGGRRLDDENDFVRIELRTALQRGIRVVPVLFDGAPMPRTVDLPADLEPLARRNKIDLDFHRFDADIGRLIGSLRKILLPEPVSEPVPAPPAVEPAVVAKVTEPVVSVPPPAPVPEPEPTPAPAKRTRRTTPRPVAAAPADPPPAPERPSAFSRFLSSAWSWGAAAVTIGYSVWQFGGFKGLEVGVALPPSAGASAPVVVASGVVLPRSVAVASAPLRIGVAVPRAAVASAPASAATELTVGQRFRDCDDDSCPWMVVLPAGSFMMGSPESEPERLESEGPQHRVQVASFAIGQYEVTFHQWDACVAAGGCKHKPGDDGWGRGQRPVINVSWNDAQQYVKWLSGKTGQTYRLPSEAEWEYAARAGTTTPFAFGERITTAQANFDGNYTYNGSARGEYRNKTLPVGSLAKDAWELYDLHGNAWEWVQDCWHDSYQGAPTDGRAWMLGCANSERLLRGGGWYDSPRYSRSAFRNRSEPTSRFNLIGFRLARL